MLWSVRDAVHPLRPGIRVGSESGRWTGVASSQRATTSGSLLVPTCQHLSHIGLLLSPAGLPPAVCSPPARALRQAAASTCPEFLRTTVEFVLTSPEFTDFSSESTDFAYESGGVSYESTDFSPESADFTSASIGFSYESADFTCESKGFCRESPVSPLNPSTWDQNRAKTHRNPLAHPPIQKIVQQIQKNEQGSLHRAPALFLAADVA
jgi:hypothetical protein